MTPALERKILRRHLAGRTAVEIACEVMIEFRAVEQVLAARDMVALAAEISAEGGRPVLDARDDVEAGALAAVADAWAGPTALIQIPEAAGNDLTPKGATIAKARKGMARTEASAVTAGRDRRLEQQTSPDRCRIAEGDADGSTLDRSEPSALRAGHRGRTSTPPEVGRKASARANEGADPRSVTVGRDRHPPSTVVEFPAPVLRHDGVPAAEVFTGTRLERAFGPGPGVGLGDLAAGQCRWPLWANGARPDFRCCGAATGEGARYCAAHARQSRGAAASTIDGLGKWASSA